MKSLITLITVIAIQHMAVAQVIEHGVAAFRERDLKGEHFFITEDWTADTYEQPSIESIRVPFGWEVWVYDERNFKGDYMILTSSWTGRDDNAWEWRNDIYSIKLVSVPDLTTNSKVKVNTLGKVALFKSREFRGEHFFITEDWTADTYEQPSIESIRVPKGWEVWVYDERNFKGDHKVLTSNWAGTDDDAWEWRNDIYSVRVVRKTYAYAHHAGGYYAGRQTPGITIFAAANFEGEQRKLSQDWNIGGTEGFYWNDKISSISIPHNMKIVVYEHANFQGRSMELTGDWTISNGSEFWNDRISSIKLLCR